jgi:hypothetical protein
MLFLMHFLIIRITVTKADVLEHALNAEYTSSVFVCSLQDIIPYGRVINSCAWFQGRVLMEVLI